jgi:hypothetical protein
LSRFGILLKEKSGNPRHITKITVRVSRPQISTERFSSSPFPAATSDADDGSAADKSADESSSFIAPSQPVFTRVPVSSAAAVDSWTKIGESATALMNQGSVLRNSISAENFSNVFLSCSHI